MLRLGQQIRLTRREAERFAEITGFEPVNVNTLDDLTKYIEGCKKHYWGVSDETRFLHHLIDKELQAALGTLIEEKASAPLPSGSAVVRLAVAGTAAGSGAGADCGTGTGAAAG